MSILLTCPNCGKKYRFAEHLAGQRVKCRGCGVAFSLTDQPAPSEADPPMISMSAGSDVDVSALASLEDPFSSMESAATPETATVTPRKVSAPRDRAPDADAVFQAAFVASRPTRRANVPFPYPGSRQLDQWLPIALPILAFLLVTLQAFVSNSSGAGWPPVVRVAVLAIGFLAVVFPLGWLAVRFAAKQAKFELPPKAKLRVAASFAFALAITAMLWLSLGSFSAAIPGLILGLVVVLGCVWLLVRINPDEAAVTLSFSGGAFVASLFILVGLLTATNAIVRSSLEGSKSQLAESPLGPGLAWDAPPAKEEPKRPGRGPVVVADATGQPQEPGAAPPTTTAVTAPPSAPQPSPASPETPPEPAPAEPPAVEPSPVERATILPGPATAPVALGPAAPHKPEPTLFPNSKLFGDSPLPQRGGGVVGGPPEDDDPDAAATTDPGSPAAIPPPPAGPPAPPAQVPAEYSAAGGDPVAFAVLGGKSPIVATVRATPTIGPFERLVAPLTPSNIALVLKSGGRSDSDLLEAWDLVALKKLTSAQVKRDATEGVAAINGIPTYAVSPDGATWARIVSFPTLSLEVTAMAGNAAPVRLPLKEPTGDASVLGYVSTDRVLVQLRSGDNVRVDVWDVKARTQSARLILPPHPPAFASAAVSPDGKSLAAVGALATGGSSFKAQLSILDIAGRAPPRTVLITGIDSQRAVRPTGIAFSPDGGRLGLLYEQNGNTVVFGYKVSPTAIAATEPLAAPAGRVAPLADEGIPAGRLSAVAGGKGWLLGANVVLDVNTGVLLGDLGVEVPCAHATVGGEVVLISGDTGQRRMTLVKMKDEKTTPTATRPAR